MKDIKLNIDTDDDSLKVVELYDLKNQSEKVTLSELIKPVGEILKE